MLSMEVPNGTEVRLPPAARKRLLVADFRHDFGDGLATHDTTYDDAASKTNGHPKREPSQTNARADEVATSGDSLYDPIVETNDLSFIRSVDDETVVVVADANAINGCRGDGVEPSQTLHLEDAELLAKLEAANRLLEADKKSLHSLTPSSSRRVSCIAAAETGDGLDVVGHSRHGSLSSAISTTSASSSSSGGNAPMEDVVGDDLWLTWKMIVDEWDNKTKRKTFHVKELARRGIPCHFRGMAWPLLCDADSSAEKDRYSEYLKMISPCEKLIRRDIARTYPEQAFFKEKNGTGQEMLFNVMKAYSLHDREVGYCQGSGFIAGLLLMQMPEEIAFAVFVKIMQFHRLRELYKPNMAEIGLCIFQLESMIREQIPELFNHFQSYGFCVSMVVSPWFLTLFAASLPLSIVFRVFDIFLIDGMETIFRVGFAILKIFSAELQTLDMEGMIKLLQRDLVKRLETESDRLFSLAFQVKYNAKKMKKLERDYNTLKSKEEEEHTEIRRLRTENRLLRQRIENLEAETVTLADRLIHDQIERAQQSEEVYALRRAVSYSRRQSCCDPTCKPPETSEGSSDKAAEAASSDTSFHDNSRNESSTIDELNKTVAEMVNEEIQSKSTIQDLRTRIREMEKMIEQLNEAPTIDIQNLQDQLIASKMREAETNLSTKELEQKVNELERYWEKHLESLNGPDLRGRPGRTKLQELSDELMSAKIRESSMTAELTDLKQKFMELETNNHIAERQIKRVDGENEKLKEKQTEWEHKEKETEIQIQDLTRHISDVESKKKEEEIMAKIKEAEHSQLLAEMRQRVAELEIQNQELQTTAQLQYRGTSGGDQQELENKIVDLQEELQMLRLRMSRKAMTSSFLARSVSVETDSDYDVDDDVASSRLRLTDSMGPLIAGDVFGPVGNVDLDKTDDDFGTPATTKTVQNEAESGGNIGVPESPHLLQTESGKTDFDKTPTNDSNDETRFAYGHERSTSTNRPGNVDERTTSRNDDETTTIDCDHATNVRTSTPINKNKTK